MTAGARRCRQAVLAVLLATTALVVLAGRARADNGAAMNVKIWGAVDQVGQPSAGQCTWDVRFNVTIFNISQLSGSGQALNISAVTPSVTADALNLDPSTQVTVISNGGLAPGVVIPNDGGSPHAFMGYEVQFTAPCSTQNGSAGVSVTDQIGTNTSTAPYVVNGVAQPTSSSTTPIALGVVGLAAAAVLLGGGPRRRRTAS